MSNKIDYSNSIILNRNLLEWEYWHDRRGKKAITFRLFIYCLLKANPDESIWKGVKVPRGSFLSTQGEMARESDLTKNQVNKALNNLIEGNIITKSSTNRYTIISIANYDDYNIKGGGQCMIRD